MLGLLSIPVFNWGNFGLNKVKSVTKKTEKTIKKTTSKSKINFTCEGNGITKFGLGAQHDTNEGFIDEYTLWNHNGYYALQLLSNQTFGRPGQVFEENSGQLTISKLTIKINYKDFLKSSEKFVTIDSYKGSISLQSGSYAGQMITTYKNLKPTVSLKGKCFGIDQVVKYLK